MTELTDSVVWQSDDLYPVRYPLPKRYLYDFMASIDDRWSVLESMGIARDDSKSPLQAWRDVVLEKNGVNDLDMGFSPIDARQFALYLA